MPPWMMIIWELEALDNINLSLWPSYLISFGETERAITLLLITNSENKMKFLFRHNLCSPTPSNLSQVGRQAVKSFLADFLKSWLWKSFPECSIHIIIWPGSHLAGLCSLPGQKDSTLHFVVVVVVFKFRRDLTTFASLCSVCSVFWIKIPIRL